MNRSVQKVTIIVEIDAIALGNAIEKDLIFECVWYVETVDLVDAVEANGATNGAGTQRPERGRSPTQLDEMLMDLGTLLLEIA